MEEREGKFVSYDAGAKEATLTDTFSGATIIAADPGGVIDAGGGGPPVDTIISIITTYVRRPGAAERIINIIRNIKA